MGLHRAADVLSRDRYQRDHRRPGPSPRGPAGPPRLVPDKPSPPRRFGYYDRLTRAPQRIYRESDAITCLRLPGAAAFHRHVAALDAALMSEDRRAVQVASQMLFTALTGAFGIGPCTRGGLAGGVSCARYLCSSPAANT